jgi:hypothetical protein
MGTIADNDIDESGFDVLVGSQWGERPTAQTFDVPERKLLVAVLADAVELLARGDARERASVLAWIRGRDARVPFRDLCYNLDLDPDESARKILRSDFMRREARRGRVAA